MEPFIEFEGKNVDKAVTAACEKLNLSKDDLKYDVLSNGSSGIFGLVGVKKARIRVSMPNSPKKGGRSKTISFQDDAGSTRDGIQSLVDEAFDDTPIPAYPEEALQLGKQALQKILDLITTDAQISVKTNLERVLFDVAGGDSGVIIGKRGQNLEAIQYLVDKIVNKCSDQRIRIQIDVEGYLKTRRESLNKLAARLAEKSKRTGKPSTINQMNAQDRRIVHLALKNDKGVRTQSVGEGYYRKLIIFPKKKSDKKRSASR